MDMDLCKIGCINHFIRFYFIQNHNFYSNKLLSQLNPCISYLFYFFQSVYLHQFNTNSMLASNSYLHSKLELSKSLFKNSLILPLACLYDITSAKLIQDHFPFSFLQLASLANTIHSFTSSKFIYSLLIYLLQKSKYSLSDTKI